MAKSKVSCPYRAADYCSSADCDYPRRKCWAVRETSETREDQKKNQEKEGKEPNER